MSINLAYASSLPERTECFAAFITEASSAQTPTGLPSPLKQLCAQALESGIFHAKPEETLALPVDSKQIPRLLLVGLPANPSHEQLRRSAGLAAAHLGKIGVSSAVLLLPENLPAPAADAIRALAEGAVLGSYLFDAYKKPPPPRQKDKPKKSPKLEQLTICDPLKLASAQTIQTAQIRANGICLARDLGNQPGNMLTPSLLADQAQKIAKNHGLKIQVMDEKKLQQEKMGLLLGVAQGSRQPPRLIAMEYRHPQAKHTLAFVGKGVTFDSGGISLKPSPTMDEMKFDMCGAAAVLGSMEVIAQLKPALNVIGVVPATENLPGGQATKPGDIHTCCNGTTVEILNTDAEGRLILADALAWTVKTFKPDAVVDLATLTGACVVALGHYASGAITNSETLQEQVVKAGKRAGESVWPLPSFPEYQRELKGKYADLQNIGGRWGGAITAGLFLKNFVDETPWVHVDIAGTAWDVKHIGHIPNSGATGVGVSFLTELALHWQPL